MDMMKEREVTVMLSNSNIDILLTGISSLFQLLCRGIQQTRSMQKWRKWSVTSRVRPSGYQPRRSYERWLDTKEAGLLINPCSVMCNCQWTVTFLPNRARRRPMGIIYKPGQAIDLFIGVMFFLTVNVSLFHPNHAFNRMTVHLQNRLEWPLIWFNLKPNILNMSCWVISRVEQAKSGVYNIIRLLF